MTGEPRAFFALDLGAATTSTCVIGYVAGHWRLLGALAFPADVPVDAVLGALVARLDGSDPALAAELETPGAVEAWPRLIARSTPPVGLAVLAASERALEPLVAPAERTGWRVRAASAEAIDPLAMTNLLLDPDVGAVLAGAGDPPGADERLALADLAALVAASAGRRPELAIVLAGGMAEHAGAFPTADGAADVVLAPAPGAGTPAGAALAGLLERARAGGDESRPAFARAVQSLADTLDRRIEAIELGLDGAVRAHATPARGDEPGTLVSAELAAAALVPRDPDEPTVDRVLGWSTVALDRHRMRDRLADLRLRPWADAVGHGAPLRLAAARAAVARLVAATPEFGDLPAPDILVVAGGAWAVAPGPAIALAVADVVRRAGATQIAYDHARLLGPIGVIEEPEERRAVLADLAGDILVPLGSVVMPQGMRAGRNGGRLVVHGPGGSSEVDLVPGGLELVDLPPGEQAVAEFQFQDAVRLGARGRHFAVDVAGGLGGLLVDLRDVPLRLPERADRRRELLAAWQQALWPGVEA